MDIMQIPTKIWTDVITGKIDCEYEFLALKILISRINFAVKQDASPEAIQKYADELRDLFINSSNIPNSQMDLQKILDKGGM